MRKSTIMRTLHFIAVVLLFAVVKNIYGGKQTSKPYRTYPKGRLLTPEEGCGYSKVANTRIVGGTVAKNGAWPWMALLYYLRKPTPSCGGSLITSRHVLTAAHCISDELYKIRLGEFDTRTTDDGQHLDVFIKKAEAHEKFNRRLIINDIAIVHLKEDVNFNDRIRPVCLPISKDILSKRFVGKNPFLVGWGRISEGGRLSPVPLQVQIPVIKNAECKESYRRIGKVKDDTQFDDRVVCAGLPQGGKDSCQGDSGGPFVLPLQSSNGTFPFYQIGIVSWAEGCARRHIPGVNTNVQYYADWIESKLK